MLLLLLLLLLTASGSESGLPSSSRLSSSSFRGGENGTGLQSADSRSLMHRLANSITSAIHFIGTVIPLRGLASLAADLGLPGAGAIMEILTPSSGASSVDGGGGSEGGGGASATPYREEMLSLVGAAFGEQDCLLKFACLAGKKVSAVTGATTLTMVMSAASGHMPEGLRNTYTALRDSIMYSDDCQQYKCEAS